MARVAWNKGKKLSEEHRKNLSESHKGNPSYWTGKHHSEETKQKISNKLKGRPSPRAKLGDTYINNQGYVQIKTEKGWFSQHRYNWITQNKLGLFFIPEGWEIHHINKDRTDNKIENLSCIPIDIHRGLHSNERWRN